ncbi:polyprenol reductase [Bufo gargarizans]|uniref:polyprenol reductase n=1 Tax=Bufo gargarizans TaxID=30331 RepID=UPI001CF5E380|nr:polyprenol reductase [Bufo gargarizans]
MLLLLLPGLSVVAGFWLLLDVVFLSALFLHLLGDCSSRRSGLCSVFQDLIRYGKTKLVGRPAWLHCFDLPKRWFWHFYLLSVIWNGALLGLLVWSLLLGVRLPQWIQLLLNFFHKESEQKISDGELSTLLALSLLWIHSLRRLLECFYVSVYSGGVIHLAQYCLGIGYYLLLGITVLDHAQLDFQKVTVTELLLQLHWYHIVGGLLYIWASLHQNRCHVILANLRRYKSGKIVTMNHKMPSGDWFERVSCPHYFAEFLIYISIAFLFGLTHWTWWLLVLFVLFNQSLAAILCHEFYHQKFDSYPARRKALIPFVF